MNFRTDNINSIFTISLDFELHWGVSDRHTVETYGVNLRNTRKAIHGMLELYKKYNIHVTWATVGMLFCRSKKELFSYVPEHLRPKYDVEKFSNYKVAEEAGENEAEDPFHFAPSIIEKIRSYPYQEIGTHTFSHYYTLEGGQDPELFRADLEAAIEIASEYGLEIDSIVFPRMQYADEYLEVCRQLGVKYYRGTQPVSAFLPVSRLHETRKRRITRFVDSYSNITRMHIYPLKDLVNQPFPVNVPQSRFIRPYSQKLKLFEPMKLNRIKSEMTMAAKNNALYHLWWHPHNFGLHTEKNLEMLESILRHYQSLSSRYGMVSMNMQEAGKYFQLAKIDVPNLVAGVEG
jgi:hypothetical protein